MKRPLAILIGCGALLTGAAAVEVGDSLADVRTSLGPPRGQAMQDSRQILYYEQGEVELQDGAVIRVALRSPEEQAALVAREEKARAAREERRAQLVAEGTALRDRKLADPNLKEAPLAYQVSYWEDLAQRYPGVSMVEPLTIARMRLAEQQAKQRKEAEEAAQAAEREERMAALDRATTVYPLFTGTRYRHFHHYYEPGLGPISYEFFSSPLPPYTTPSGNPAGNLSGPMINLPSFNPALPTNSDLFQREHGRRRGFDRLREDDL